MDPLFAQHACASNLEVTQCFILECDGKRRPSRGMYRISSRMCQKSLCDAALAAALLPNEIIHDTPAQMINEFFE